MAIMARGAIKMDSSKTKELFRAYAKKHGLTFEVVDKQRPAKWAFLKDGEPITEAKTRPQWRDYYQFCGGFSAMGILGKNNEQTKKHRIT